MIEHDAQIGRLLDAVDQGGFAANTIVIYTSDNGPMVCLWPDAGATPFRGEKNTNWEGGWRVPAMIRWPGTIQPGSVINDIFAGEDWLPTLLAAAGVPGVKEKLLSGYKAGRTSFKVHLDGYDQTALLAGRGPGKRKEFFYFSDDGDLLAVRHDRLKVHFMVQNATGIDVWRKPFETLRAPIFFDLRSDPTERGQDGIGYDEWWYRHSFYAMPVQKAVGEFIATFQAFPPRQKPGSFTVGDALSALSQASGSR
jgi:arylsulfatase